VQNKERYTRNGIFANKHLNYTELSVNKKPSDHNNKTAFTYNSNLSVYPLGCQQMGRPDFESQPNLATNNSEAAKQTPKSTAGLLDA